MSMLVVLLIIWGILTTILIVLLIYRSTLTMHEDEQLFLDDSSSHLAEEQRILVARVNKLTPLIRVFWRCIRRADFSDRRHLHLSVIDCGAVAVFAIPA